MVNYLIMNGLFRVADFLLFKSCGTYLLVFVLGFPVFLALEQPSFVRLTLEVLLGGGLLVLLGLRLNGVHQRLV